MVQNHLDFDRNRNGGGFFFCLRGDISCREIKSDNLSDDIKRIFIELNLKKVKWLLFSTHHPPSQSGWLLFLSC